MRLPPELSDRCRKVPFQRGRTEWRLSPKGAASNSPGQASAPPWVTGEKAFCPVRAASQNRVKLVPFVSVFGISQGVPQNITLVFGDKDERKLNPNTEVEDCYLWGAHSSRVLAEASRLSELGAVWPILLALPPLPVRNTKDRCSGPLQPTCGTHVLPGKESSAAGSSPYPASEFRLNCCSLASPRQDLKSCSSGHDKKCPTWDIFCEVKARSGGPCRGRWGLRLPRSRLLRR